MAKLLSFTHYFFLVLLLFFSGGPLMMISRVVQGQENHVMDDWQCLVEWHCDESVEACQKECKKEYGDHMVKAWCNSDHMCQCEYKC
ncbi:hypothetical protein BVC80_8889g11 [Macleaya cordata]|uniref:Uncharacterized protein n=1 Tax=Macleaya cordata TaxID=56857 RepID=A0A200Q737_MACCD|nr:hypothetical protein BVC80_8889g11 [Macleaya cordata]